MRLTTISLELGDHSVKYLVCVLEDVPTKIGDLYLLVDFLILEMEEDMYTPLFLGGHSWPPSTVVLMLKMANYLFMWRMNMWNLT